MKFILFAFFMPITMLFSDGQMTVPATTDVVQEEKATLPKKVEIEIELEFGRKKLGCEKLGVCKVSGSAGIKGILGGNRAVAKATAEDGQVTEVVFLRASMSKKTISTYFSGPHFIVGEDFSTSFSHKGGKFTFKLKAGKYRLKKTKEGFVMGMPPSW